MLLLYHFRAVHMALILKVFTFHYASTLSITHTLIFYFRFDLHSTMLLLYRSHNRNHAHSPGIYIPLCFYFIVWPSSNISSIASYLHSTMLLLYLTPRHSAHTPDLHLHSTMLLLYLVLHEKGTIPHIYLHSTMLLLYPSRAVTFPPFDAIYIPLCFYFIGYKVTERGREFYLHSTMLLLYRNQYFSNKCYC